MARLEDRATVEVTVTLHLTEAEIGALDALAGYGDKAFLDVFYEHLGRAYLHPHEGGLRSLFEAVRGQAGGIIRRAQAARDAYAKADPAIAKKGGDL